MRSLVIITMCGVALAEGTVFAQPPAEKVTVAGRVIDGTSGKPVPHAVVEIYPAGKPSIHIQFGGNMDNWIIAGERRDHSDSNGHFRCEGILEGDYIMFAWLPGSISDRQRIPVARGMPEVTLSLFPMGSVSGVVSLPDGSPAANRRAFIGYPVAVVLEKSWTNHVVMLDSAGRFSLQREVTGDVQVSVVVRGVGFGVSEPFHVSPAKEYSGLNVRLRPGGTANVQVRKEPDDKPLAGIRIEATTTWKGALLTLKGVTDRVGLCRLAGLPAEGNAVEVTCFPGEGQNAHAELFLKPDSPNSNCILHLGIPGDVTPVGGRLFLPDGKASFSDGEFRVYFCSRFRDLLRWEQMQHCGTDPEGQFTLWLDPHSPRPEVLVISAPGLGYATGAFPTGSTIGQIPPLVLTRGEVTESQLDDPERGFIGIGLDKGPDGFVINSVFEDSAAERAGIRAGDVLLRVDGNLVGQDSLQELFRKLAGQPDTEVMLAVKRAGLTLPLSIRIVRGKRMAAVLVLKPRKTP